MRDFVERVYTRYSSLLRTQKSRYRDRPSAILGDGQAPGENLDGYRVRLGEGGEALHVVEADSDEECRDSTSTPAG